MNGKKLNMQSRCNVIHENLRRIPVNTVTMKVRGIAKSKQLVFLAMVRQRRNHTVAKWPKGMNYEDIIIQQHSTKAPSICIERFGYTKY